MSISRKEFLCRGIFEFGKELVETMTDRTSDKKEGSCREEYRHQYLDNSRCLAQKGGCFTCIDHCPHSAVTIDPGRGIAIDQGLCDGCGECAAVCPITPKVITMKALGVASIHQERSDT